MGKVSKQAKQANSLKDAKPKSDHQTTKPKQANAPVSKDVLVAENLPPIGLVFTVIACSGFLFVFSFRDVFATGKVIGGSSDEALLVGQIVILELSVYLLFLHHTRSFQKQRTSLMTRKDGSRLKVD